MYNVYYYKSTYKEWLRHYAKALGEAAGTKIEVQGNSLLFPPDLAAGRYEFYELTDGLSLLLVDYVFLRPVKFRSVRCLVNDTYIISYFLSGAIKFENKDGRAIEIGQEIPHTAFLTSEGMVANYNINANERVKALQLIFNRSWGLKNLSGNSIQVNSKKTKPFVTGEPVQISATYSHKTVELIEEIFGNNTPLPGKTYLMEGYACKLAALVFNDLIEKKSRRKYRQNEGTMKVIRLKELIGQNLENIPPAADAAKACIMSESKFLQLFKAIFKTSYSAFFMDKRMKKAKVLLSEGSSVTDTSYAIGYSEVANFSKAFKEYFGIGPKEYVKGYLQKK